MNISNSAKFPHGRFTSGEPDRPWHTARGRHRQAADL